MGEVYQATNLKQAVAIKVPASGARA